MPSAVPKIPIMRHGASSTITASRVSSVLHPLGESQKPLPLVERPLEPVSIRRLLKLPHQILIVRRVTLRLQQAVRYGILRNGYVSPSFAPLHLTKAFYTFLEYRLSNSEYSALMFLSSAFGSMGDFESGTEASRGGDGCVEEEEAGSWGMRFWRAAWKEMVGRSGSLGQREMMRA